MSVPRIDLSLESLTQICRRLHAAASHEAELVAGLGTERAVASPVLRSSYNNVRSQLQAQATDPFVAGIPACDDTTDVGILPALTAQLLGAVLAVAAPTMTPKTVAGIWDDVEDGVYDAL